MTFEQSEKLEPEQLLAVRGVASVIIGTGSKFMSLPPVHAHGTNAQAGYCLCMNYISMFCEHVLLIIIIRSWILATLSHDCDTTHTC